MDQPTGRSTRRCAMSRSVPEWIGSSDDAKVPPRVRLRIWEREDGKCWISGRKIMPGEPWELDHKVALINGGEHRESNLFPALKDKHREKTKLDVAEKATTARKRAKHIGAKPKTGFATNRAGKFKRTFDGRIIPR